MPRDKGQLLEPVSLLQGCVNAVILAYGLLDNATAMARLVVTDACPFGHPDPGADGEQCPKGSGSWEQSCTAYHNGLTHTHVRDR